MPNARSIVNAKREPIAWLPPDATALDAAQLMNERRIGSVLVLDGGRLTGIFTERDILRRIVAEQRDPATTPLADVTTTVVACATPDTIADELRMVMRERRIRHIPVVEGDRVIGMVSIGDLNRVDHDVQINTIRYLEQYMSVT